MKDFIQNLYSNPNFPLYLGIVIMVLLATFFIVYLLGKRDQEKLAETKKLETVENNAFNEVSTPVAVEAPTVEPEEVKVEAPVIEPIKEEVIEPSVEETQHEEESIISEPTMEPIKEEAVEPLLEEPVISAPEVKVEQSTIPDTIQLSEEDDGYKAAHAKYEEITKDIDKDLNELENKMVKPVLNETIEPPISMPTVETVEPPEVKKTEVVNEVFSSVYAPKKDPIMFDDTVEIELPRLK